MPLKQSTASDNLYTSTKKTMVVFKSQPGGVLGVIFKKQAEKTQYIDSFFLSVIDLQKLIDHSGRLDPLRRSNPLKPRV